MCRLPTTTVLLWTMAMRMIGALNNIHAFAFQPFVGHHHHHQYQHQQFYNTNNQGLFAKPPPSAQFDLEAIEQYEQSLLADKVNQEEEIEIEEEIEEEEHTLLLTYTIPEELNNQRIDAAIAMLVSKDTHNDDNDKNNNWSRSVCGNLVSNGHVELLLSEDDNNNTLKILKKSEKVKTGQQIQVRKPSPQIPTEIVPQNIPLDILYEDEYMIVVNKRAGMVVHPAAGNWDGTLVNALAYYLQQESLYGSGDFATTTTTNNMNDNSNDIDNNVLSFRPGIVHRLDKGTTGIIIVAKTQQALTNLSHSFASRTVKKTYLAVTVGNPGTKLVIDKPIGRHPTHRQKMRVVPVDDNGRNSRIPTTTSTTTTSKGKRALSFVNTLFFDRQLSLAQVRIMTGRTHQIRVHLQDHHTPVYGDEVYGFKDWNAKLKRKFNIKDRPLLHAFRLEIDHPIHAYKGKMVFTAPMPTDMCTIVDSIWPTGREERPELFE